MSKDSDTGTEMESPVSVYLRYDSLLLLKLTQRLPPIDKTGLGYD
jgi:hypothetical protein